MAEPMMKLDPNGRAPVLSYQLPDATSYPGRNYVRLELSPEVFRPELRMGGPDSDSLRGGRGGGPAFESSPLDPVLGELELPAGVGVRARADGQVEFLGAEPLDPSLTALRRDDVVALVEAGLRPTVVRSLTGALTLVPVAASATSGDDEDPSSGGTGGQTRPNIEISSPTPDAQVTGPQDGVDVLVTGGAEVQTGLGVVTDVDARIDDGDWVQATPDSPGNWGHFEVTLRISAPGWHEIKVRAKRGKAEKTVTQRISAVLTGPASNDRTAPAITITQPSGSPVLTSPNGSGSFQMSGTASDPSGVAAVETSLDATDQWVAVTPRAPNDFSTWSAEVTASGAGNHVVHIRARDGVGNVGRADMPFTIIQRQERTLLRSYLMLVESYRLSSFLGRYGAGRVLKTFSLLPGERTKISVKSWQRTSETSTAASSIVDSVNATSANEFSSGLQRENTDKQTSADEFKWKVEGEVEQGWGTGRAKVSAGASGGCNAARERFGKTVSGVTDKHIAEKSSKRDVTINSEYERTVEQGEETSIEREIQNINASRTINFVFRQMNQEFISILHLVDIRVAFVRMYDVGKGPNDPEADYREVRLMELPSLLEQAIVPGKRADVEELLMDALRNVADFEDTLHDVTETVLPKNSQGEEVPEAGYMRIRRNLRQTYRPDPEDPATGVTVPGIIVAATTNTMRTEGIVVDALLGQGNGLDAYSQGLQDAAVDERIVANDRVRQETAAAKQLVEIVDEKDTQAAKVYKTLHPAAARTEFTLNVNGASNGHVPVP